MRSKFLVRTFCLLVAATSPFAYSSGSDKSAESAALLSKILDGNDALTQASEFSVEHRTVSIAIDGSEEDAKQFCPQIDAIVEQHGLSFSEGWVVEIASPSADYEITTSCPL